MSLERIAMNVHQDFMDFLLAMDVNHVIAVKLRMILIAMTRVNVPVKRVLLEKHVPLVRQDSGVIVNMDALVS